MKRPIIRKTKFISLALALILTGCGHEHNFSEATCESQRICLECGETEGEPLEHQWLEATIESPMTCSLCGLTEGEPLPVEEPEVKEEEATKAEEEAYQALKDAGIDLSTYTEQELAIILDILEKQEPVNPNKHTPVESDSQYVIDSGELTDPGSAMDYTINDPRLQGGTME